MAIYHLHVQIIGRTNRHGTAVNCAAYRSGERLHDDQLNRNYDYSHRKDVIYNGVLLPPHAPPEYSNREVLWNAVERAEKQKNAQLAREINVALPAELPLSTCAHIIREFCLQEFVCRGMIADFAIHDKDTGNPHAHIMLTMRPIGPDGQWMAKSRKEYILDDEGNRIVTGYDTRGKPLYKNRKVSLTGWDDRSNVSMWRASWADMCNRYLEPAHQIDHRSYERQHIDAISSGHNSHLELIPSIHEGYYARQLELTGIRSDRCEHNRQVQEANRQLFLIRDQKYIMLTYLKEELEYGNYTKLGEQGYSSEIGGGFWPEETEGRGIYESTRNERYNPYDEGNPSRHEEGTRRDEERHCEYQAEDLEL